MREIRTSGSMRGEAVVPPYGIASSPTLPILIVERMHLKRRVVDEIARAGVSVVKMVIA